MVWIVEGVEIHEREREQNLGWGGEKDADDKEEEEVGEEEESWANSGLSMIWL